MNNPKRQLPPIGQRSDNLSKGKSDLISGALKFPLWWSLAWQETKQRYRRSILGPFWITISTGVMVAAMGPLYGALLGQNISTYLQHLAVSLIIWHFISSCINESGAVFIASEGFIKQISLPLSLYIYRMIARNLIIFAHNIIIVVVVLLFIPPSDSLGILLFPLGFFLVVGNLFWVALLLALCSARYRDVPQLVGNLVQVAFFLSPIIWKVDMLSSNRRFLAEFNPLYHLIEVIRAPILGDPIYPLSWILCCTFFLFGSVVTFFVFARLRPRVPYWL